jgi:hypothetical protein
LHRRRNDQRQSLPAMNLGLIERWPARRDISLPRVAVAGRGFHPAIAQSTALCIHSVVERCQNSIGKARRLDQYRRDCIQLKRGLNTFPVIGQRDMRGYQGRICGWEKRAHVRTA